MYNSIIWCTIWILYVYKVLQLECEDVYKVCAITIWILYVYKVCAVTIWILYVYKVLQLQYEYCMAIKYYNYNMNTACL